MHDTAKTMASDPLTSGVRVDSTSPSLPTLSVAIAAVAVAVATVVARAVATSPLSSQCRCRCHRRRCRTGAEPRDNQFFTQRPNHYNQWAKRSTRSMTRFRKMSNNQGVKQRE